MARRYQRHSRQVATRARAVTQQAYSRSHTNQLLASAARHPVSSEYIGNRPEQRIIRNRLLLLWLLLQLPSCDRSISAYYMAVLDNCASSRSRAYSICNSATRGTGRYNKDLLAGIMGSEYSDS